MSTNIKIYWNFINSKFICRQIWNLILSAIRCTTIIGWFRKLLHVVYYGKFRSWLRCSKTFCSLLRNLHMLWAFLHIALLIVCTHCPLRVRVIFFQFSPAIYFCRKSSQYIKNYSIINYVWPNMLWALQNMFHNFKNFFQLYKLEILRQISAELLQMHT